LYSVSVSEALGWAGTKEAEKKEKRVEMAVDRK